VPRRLYSGRVPADISPRRGPEEPRPELRASHADRDRVVEVLRVAAGDGRLSPDELDERLEAALTARTVRELTVLTADLPAGGSQTGPVATAAAAPKDVMRIRHRGGHARHVGQWVVPQRMEIQVTGGNVRLDFTEAVISSAALPIDVQLKGGNLIIITRPGVVVDAAELAMVGGRVRVQTASGPQPPEVLRVEVTGEIRGGNLRARGPRRPFWQRLLRRGHPGDRPGPRALRA
jgi:hypothetical protein